MVNTTPIEYAINKISDAEDSVTKKLLAQNIYPVDI